MEVDEKRQRISLTMRLDEAPGSGPRPGAARTDANIAAAPVGRDRRTAEPTRASARVEAKPGGAIALALERAKLKSNE